MLIRERRIAKRNGGWDKVGGDHLTMAKRAKKHLRKSIRGVESAAKKPGGGGWGSIIAGSASTT